MGDQKTDIKCTNCGEAFCAFLREMAEHNARVVFPRCGKVQDREHVFEGAKAALRKEVKPETEAREPNTIVRITCAAPAATLPGLADCRTAQPALLWNGLMDALPKLNPVPISGIRHSPIACPSDSKRVEPQISRIDSSVFLRRTARAA
jgi:hypothetical protein